VCNNYEPFEQFSILVRCVTLVYYQLFWHFVNLGAVLGTSTTLCCLALYFA